MEKVSKGDRVEVEGRRGTVISTWEHENKRIYLVHFDDGQKGYVREEDIALAKDALERLVDMDLDDFIDFVLYVDATRLLLEYAYNPFVLASTSKIDVVPHQVAAVARMVSVPTPRFLLADDVGLGKTIETGMVLEELRERGVAKKVLLVVPAALRRQWQREMEEKFGVRYVIVDSEYLRAKRKEGIRNPFEALENLIVSMDYAKKEHIKDLICKVPWDIVIVDEAHKFSVRPKGAGVEKTDRYMLGEDLGPKTKSLILLTATPHNGDNQDFASRLILLNPYLATSGSLDDLMIRRIKEDVYRLERENGKLVEKPIFPPRKSETVEVSLSSDEKTFYDDLTDYIKASFETARKRLGETAKFQSVMLALMILQRRAASSLHAASISLQNRINRIKERAVTPEEAQELLEELRNAEEEGEEDKAEELRRRLEGVSIYTGEELQQEIRELEKLRDRAKALEIEDSKAKRLLSVLETVKRGDPEGKVLVFTEYRDTLEYLLGILTGAGYSLASIHGGMDFDVRVDQEIKFKTEADFMVATDAAGEGLNLQFSNIVVNYEIPWNPNRLEQRIGRVHRYGQTRNVFVYNFLAADTIEERVWNKVLEKLEVIRNKLGDRVFDVLGRIITEKDIHKLYRELMLAPQAEWEAATREIEERMEEKLEFLDQIERLLIRDRLSPDEFKVKYTINPEKTVDEEEVKRFVDIYVRRHGGKVTPLGKDIVDIITPQSVLSTVETPVIRGSFNKRTALNKGIDYIALGNKAVMAMVRHASQDTDKATVLKAPRLSKGVLLFYKTATVDRLQNIHDEHLVPLFYDADSKDLTEIDPRAIWDYEPIDGDVKPDPDLIEMAGQKAASALEEIVDRLTMEARERASARAKKKREAALMHYTSLIESAEDRVKEYEKRAIMEPHFKGLAAAERKKIEMCLKDQTEALSLIEKEAEVSPTLPELVAAAMVLPSAPKEADMKKIAKAEEMKRKVEDAGMMEAMRKERREGREPVDVSREFCGYDIISYLPETLPKEGEYPQKAIDAERLIEVKAFKETGYLELTSNEWDKARRWGEKYWLYAVEDTLTKPQLTAIRNPFEALKDRAEMVPEVTYKWIIKDWKDIKGD